MTILQAGPEVDVWSLGGVLSETATWLAQGKDGLERYRELRTSCLRDCGLGDSDCFHDGVNVLQSVINHHNNISNTIPKGDIITEKVLELVSNMLTGTQNRKDARTLRVSAVKALAQSKSMLAETEGDHSTLSVPKTQGIASVGTTSSVQIDSVPQRNKPLHSSSSYDPTSENFRRETGSHTARTQCRRESPPQGKQSQLMSSQWTLSGIQQLRQCYRPLPGQTAHLKNRRYVGPTIPDLKGKR